MFQIKLALFKPNHLPYFLVSAVTTHNAVHTRIFICTWVQAFIRKF